MKFIGYTKYTLKIISNKYLHTGKMLKFGNKNKIMVPLLKN